MLHMHQCQKPIAAILGTVVLLLLLETSNCKPASSDGNRDKILPLLYKKAERFNFDEVVQSKRLFRNYVYCFVEKGPCTESAKDGRVLLRDLVDKWCVDVCSAKLKRNFQVALRAIRDRHPEEWQLFLKRIDPTEVHRTKLMKFMEGKE